MEEFITERSTFERIVLEFPIGRRDEAFDFLAKKDYDVVRSGPKMIDVDKCSPVTQLIIAERPLKTST